MIHSFFFTTALDLPTDRLGWIGFMDFSGNKSDIRWISNNASLSFTNWIAGEPNNVGEDCGAIVLTSSTSDDIAEWGDTLCSFDIFHAVCEAERVSGSSYYCYVPEAINNKTNSSYYSFNNLINK